jgi:hypothetical protein
MNTIEIAHVANFDYVKIYINTELVTEQYNCASVACDIPHKFPFTVSVEFSPFKIKPIVRYNNFMLDYWLADIVLQDHKLELSIKETFYQDYKNKNINGRIASLPMEQQNIEHFWDKYIGINNLHPDLINEVKHLINK